MLRDVAWGDIDLREAWFADEEVTRYLGLVDGRPGQSLQDATGRGIEWTVALKSTGEAVGIAQLGRIDTDAGQACLGLVIGRKDLWGQGLGGDILQTLLAYGFDEMQLNRLYLTVEERHTRARALYERHGFKVEGHLRKARMTGDGLQDVLIMGLLRDEWDGARADHRP